MSHVAIAQDTQKDLKSFTNLFNHKLWAIYKTFNISVNCASDLNKYLVGLKELKVWALQVNDASAHSSGHYSLENDYWFGSKKSCNQLGFWFYMTQVSLRVNVLRNNSRVLKIGQCLPKSCSIHDVVKLLNKDPAGLELKKSSKLNEFEVLSARKVPGDKRLMDDVKFPIFL